MKTRYTTIDIKAAIAEINASEAIGLRVINVYDIDNKTYLVRLVHGDKKFVLLIESGSRIHLTEYDWPKNMLPSPFSMKCRKHLKGRRLASVKQLGVDRIVDLQFGYDEAAYHLIVELYDRGNIILTDYEYSILQLLRVRTDADKDVRFAVREKYPWELARSYETLPTREKLKEHLEKAKANEQLKRVLNPLFVFGPALLEHALISVGIQSNAKVNQINLDNEDDFSKLDEALHLAERILNDINKPSEIKNGYIIQKKEKVIAKEKDTPTETYLSNTEFHPFLYNQHKSGFPYKELPSFNKAVDEFFSRLESQKIDMKALQQEKAALKRLENVKQDHEKRIQALQTSQDDVARKAEVIEINLPLVERAIATINSAIANQIDWEEIEEIVEEAKSQNDPVAVLIKSLQLEKNKITLSLVDPFQEVSESESEDDDDNHIPDDNDVRKKEKFKNKKNKESFIHVDIDLGQTAFANARSYHNQRRQAATKEKKTMQASKKALKSAEQKTQETLKEVQTSKMINKTRKTYWFEKFFWFISSENYLVIGGRDQQQNELVVKRYLRPGDLYVHADLHGASSVILKNPSGKEVPPKTLNEAGNMAICYSAAWEARVVTSAWWVHHHQVSKTAPSGEYLTTGSFMIRGKKNYLPPSYLVMGFSILFKLDDGSIVNHNSDRKIRTLVDNSETSSTISEMDHDEEININDEDEDDTEVADENAIEEKITNNKIKEDTLDNEIIEHSEQDQTNKEENDIKDSSGEKLEIDELLSTSNSEPNLNSAKNEFISHDMNTASSTTELHEEEMLFPDTNIQLQHIAGEKFELQRGFSSPRDEENEGEHFVYLGDGTKVPTTKQEPENRKPKLSAKQKRDLKKKKKQELEEHEIQNTENETTNQNLVEKEKEETKNNVSQPLKRGQKSKQKRKKEKYKDQDDEDRELMQQILKAGGPQKAPKKKSKEKGKEKQINKPKPKKLNEEQPLILHQPDNVNNHKSHDPKPQPDDDEDFTEDIEKENINVLDSLTGCPIAEDTLLYALPICAPYSCMQNYKFKVKLTPGTGKRGKAAKTALHMFQVSKEASDWEKDLMKNLKDVDISRNIPGKVKVSAPNLNRAKKK